MRAIGHLPDEKRASAFSSFLSEQGIENSYESSSEGFLIWVQDEELFVRASQLLEEFKREPSIIPSIKKSKGKVLLQIAPHSSLFSLTYFLLALCIILFIWMHLQEERLLQKGAVASQIGLVSIEQVLLFDYSDQMRASQRFIDTHDLKAYDRLENLPPAYQTELQKIDQIPTWQGIYPLLMNGFNKGKHVALFHDIRKGEVWRLFTPILLHFNFLHLLFNMSWLWMLGRQIENRLGKMRLLLLTLAIALISNIAQYLMTGPLFLGYSGVVVGMVTFIWMRQKMAPWEGYPLPKSTTLFLMVFVLAILVLGFLAFILQMTHLIEGSPNIANTAHIVGGIVGICLAKMPYFSRKVR